MVAVPIVPPAPGRFSTTMAWPSLAASRSNTTRGTTSAALPAPNGIVALIRCEGQLSACAAATNTAIPATNPQRTTPRIRHSGSHTRSDEDVHRFARRCKLAGDVTIRGGWAGLTGLKANDAIVISPDKRELQQQSALDRREIVVGHHGQHGLTLRREMGVDAFHVVDLVGEIGLEDRGAVNDGARRHRTERDTPDTNANPGNPGEFPLQYQEIAGGQQHGVADIELLGAANAELSRARAPDQKRDEVAVGIEPAL